MTGGVSLTAAQFAIATGATIVATTSSSTKADILKSMVVSHVINYLEITAWGDAVKSLIPNGRGFDHLLQIGGAATIDQSWRAMRLEGLITIIGFFLLWPRVRRATLHGSFASYLHLRGIFVGSREQFVKMNRAIDVRKIKPVVNPKMFFFDEMKAAYEYLWDRKNFGKTVVRV